MTRYEPLDGPRGMVSPYHINPTSKQTKAWFHEAVDSHRSIGSMSGRLSKLPNSNGAWNLSFGRIYQTTPEN